MPYGWSRMARSGFFKNLLIIVADAGAQQVTDCPQDDEIGNVLGSLIYIAHCYVQDERLGPKRRFLQRLELFEAYGLWVVGLGARALACWHSALACSALACSALACSALTPMHFSRCASW